MGINEMGFEVFEEMLDYSDELKIEIHEMENGAVVADAGVKADGGLGAGVYLSRLCMADLADIQLTPFYIKDILLPGIQVATDYPAISCMASQCAMWQIKVDKYFAMGSGPARVLAKKTRELYDKIGFEECSDVGVLVLESSRLPDEKTCSFIAEKCSIDPADLRIAIAPTDSVAGLVQVSARVVETGLHKLFAMGFDITKIKCGWGRAPISPITGDATMCMGSSNDAIIYGGETCYTLKYENLEELQKYQKDMPSSASRDWGAPFYKTFKAAGFDFFKVDHNVFAPARVVMNETRSRRTLVSGRINPDVLAESFGLQNLDAAR
ncbi:MAG TPA: methenyltetrahydromethanopterin cyclohydrolase [Methanothrix sp.]|nr:methenyltetrahydromethanopterin cyclohydrolase [Methanothrix sp.]HPT37674.1 methenyltetrahydromethanopterin cyclohydrolase [Methanothrix sp.]